MSSAESRTTLVTVTFEGLMIFHFDRDKNLEVGVVNGARGHMFTIGRQNRGGRKVEVDSGRIETARALGNNWSLDVVRAGEIVPGAIKPYEKGHRDRHDRGDNVQQDFSWIMNLEGREFHNKRLPLRRGGLSPVMRFSSGTLYTSCKTDGLDRKQGLDGDDYRPFGFVAETIAIDTKLEEGESLVLRVAGGGGEGEVFRLDHTPGERYVVALENMDHTHAGLTDVPTPSHFQYSYDLIFTSVPREERFEIRLSKDAGGDVSEPSPTPCPKPPGPMTVDPYKCGGVFIESPDPLP